LTDSVFVYGVKLPDKGLVNNIIHNI